MKRKNYLSPSTFRSRIEVESAFCGASSEVTNPDKALMKKHFEKLEMGEMLDRAVRETVIYAYNAKGEEIIQEAE